jgi:hypothetical protein
MRTSRVVLAGIAVAATAATTSAFTASNTFSPDATANSVAGYKEAGVTGATVTDIAYNAYPTDPTYLDNIVLTLSTNVYTQQITVTLKKSGQSAVHPYSCINAPYANGSMTATCSVVSTVDGSRPTFESFDSVGVTVAHPTPAPPAS